MEAVKVWGFSMCAAVVIGSIVTMILPSIEKQKIIKLVISAFVLAGVVSPLLNVINGIDISAQALEQNGTEDSQFQLDENTFQELENSVSQAIFPLIQQELEKMNIDSDFGINTELAQEQDGISVKCVNITISDLHMIEKDELELLLEDTLGLTISIESEISGEYIPK